MTTPVVPSGITTVTLTGRYLRPDFTPLKGTVTIATPALLTLPGADTISTGSATATLDATGAFSMTLIATDQANMQPEGWAYQVTEKFQDILGRTYAIQLPGAVPVVDIADIAPADPSQGQYITVSSVNGMTGAITLNSASVGAVPRAIVPIDQLVSGNPFYIAHRGSGGEFPEHTMEAYESAVAAGAQAIEVSVNLSADGVPVCIHDGTLDRTTYTSGNVADWNYAALHHKVLTNGRLLLGQGRPDVPLPTLRDVLDRFMGKVVIFLEPKSNPSVPVVQQFLLDNYPHAKDSVVWKNYYQATSFAWAKANGFKTWAYVDAATTDAQMNALDQSLVDFWGVPQLMADARMQAVVARGKPVICWEVHRRSERDRLLSLGVRGMMCSELIYVRRNAPSRTADDFATQIKAPGNLGTINYDAPSALKYDDTGGSAYINALPNRSVVLGSLSNPAPPGTYTIRFDMMYETAPVSTEHAGIAFGKVSDDIYRFSQANTSGGYHMAIRGNGDMQLYTHTAGVTAGTQLGTTVATAAPTAGGWMSFTIQVTPTQIILTRTDGTPASITVSNTAFRGGYFHLSTGSISTTATKPHWRNVSVV
jgi:glycerophosphoryl diester phosphodiesterase